MNNILNKDNKVKIVKQYYDIFTNQLNDMQIHIDRCYKNYYLQTKERAKYMKKINELTSMLNELFNSIISNNKLMCDEHINYNFEYNDLYKSVIYHYQIDTLFGKNKNNTLVSGFYQITYGILSIGKQIGFKSLHNGLQIILGDFYQDILDNNEKNKLCFFNNIFVPLNYKIKRFNNDASISPIGDSGTVPEISICNKFNKSIFVTNTNIISSVIMDNGGTVNIKIDNNKYVSFDGYFIIDSLNIIIKTSQLCFPELYQKKIELDNKIIKSNLNINFSKLYSKYFQYYHYLTNTTHDLIDKINKAYKLYNKVNKISFIDLASLFTNGDIIDMFDIIKVLLVKSDNNQAGILFNLIKSRKIKSIIVSDIIYNNLNYALQIKLKKSAFSIKTELDKIRTLAPNCIGYEKQLILSSMPEIAKMAAMEKIEEIQSSNGDNSKQILYVKSLLNFPWPKESDFEQFKELGNNKEKGKKFIENAIKTLDDKIYGHKECKEEIQEMICKWMSNPQCYGGAIGLAGPPGVGKTLIAKALGTALSIPFVQITLGGQNDGDLLHGHSYTYNSAQPGLIIKKMIEAGNSRCILFFDELDKTSSRHGSNEIYNILIHLIDPNTNSQFQDRFFQEVTFPLNNVIFVFSYNDHSLIDPILYDRIKEIEVKPYTVSDKIKIAKDFLIKEICSNICFDYNSINIHDRNLEYIIDNYTYEAGVRSLNRKLEKIIMRLNVDKIYDRGVFMLNSTNINITDELINSFLKEPIVQVRQIHSTDAIGIVNGLYATTYGKGGLTPIQVYNNFTGTSRKFIIKMTGSLGKTMRESSLYAFTTAMSLLDVKVRTNFVKNNPQGIHIHTPDAASKKDGPSAGGAITTAIISKILNKTIKRDIAMTGEIEPTGNITAIGGLIYKLYGAKRAGVKIVYIPKENEKDLKKILKENNKLLTKDFNVILVEHIIDILKEVINDFDIHDFSESIRYLL